jgi:5-methylcytosine-specific restriction endonuclease McrA
MAMSFPAVFWHANQDLFLHPECARKLATGLLTDFEIAQRGRESWLKKQANARENRMTALSLEDDLREEQGRSQNLYEELQKARLKLDDARVDYTELAERFQQSLRVPREASAPVAPRLDPQRAFNAAQKKEIYLRSNGHCTGCGQPLDSDWHADHIVPHARGGRTEIINGQGLCQPCNNRKHAKVLTVDGG